MKLSQFRTLVICLLFGLFCFDAYAQKMYANTLTVRNRFILDNYEINEIENTESLSGDTRTIPTSYTVLNHIDSVFGGFCLPLTVVNGSDTATIKLSGAVVVVPPLWDGRTISAAYGAGDSDAGNATVYLRVNGVNIDTLASIDTSGIVTSSGINYVLSSGDVISFDIASVSGFLVGLGITLLLL